MLVIFMTGSSQIYGALDGLWVVGSLDYFDAFDDSWQVDIVINVLVVFASLHAYHQEIT